MEPTTDTRSRLAGTFFLVLTLAGWASSPLFLKYFVDYIDAWTSNGWRYAIAAVFWLPILIRRRGSAGFLRGLSRAAIWPAVFNSLGQCAFAWTLYLEVDPGLMAFLLRVQIISVTVGAFLLFADERVLIRHRNYWLGLLLVVGGTAGTIFLGHQLPAGTSVLGVAMGLSSGAMFGCYGVAVRACMRRYSPMSSFAMISLYTAAAMVALMVIFGQDHGAVAWQLSGLQMLMLFISAMAGIALGHVFYYASIVRLGLAAVSVSLLMHPFVTAVMSWLLYAERLTVLQWFSGAAGVLGAMLVLRTQGRLQATAAKHRAARAAHAQRERACLAEVEAVRASEPSQPAVG